MYLFMYVCMYVCLYACNVCIYVCMNVCMYVMYVCMYIYIYIYIYIYVCMNVCIYVWMNYYALRLLLHIWTDTHTYIYADKESVAYPVPQEASTSTTTFVATDFWMSGSHNTFVSSLNCRMNSIAGNSCAQRVRSAHGGEQCDRW